MKIYRILHIPTAKYLNYDEFQMAMSKELLNTFSLEEAKLKVYGMILDEKYYTWSSKEDAKFVLDHCKIFLNLKLLDLTELEIEELEK